MKTKIIFCLVAIAALNANAEIKTNVSKSMGINSSFQTHSVDEKVNKMNEVVGLTDSQKIKYRALVEKKKLQNDFKKNYEIELKKILTPEQLKKLEDKKSKSK